MSNSQRSWRRGVGSGEPYTEYEIQIQVPNLPLRIICLGQRFLPPICLLCHRDATTAAAVRFLSNLFRARCKISQQYPVPVRTGYVRIAGPLSVGILFPRSKILSEILTDGSTDWHPDLSSIKSDRSLFSFTSSRCHRSLFRANDLRSAFVVPSEPRGSFGPRRTRASRAFRTISQELAERWRA